jgi:SprT-like family
MMNKTPLTNKTLKAAFHAFNREYFDYRLPNSMEVRFSKRFRYDNVGPSIGVTFMADDGRLVIVINRKYQHSRRIVLSTLLHEMIHAVNWDVEKQHECDLTGWNSFNKEALRIAKLGAFNGLW